jgi:hypothetical protein
MDVFLLDTPHDSTINLGSKKDGKTHYVLIKKLNAIISERYGAKNKLFVCNVLYL